MWQMIVQKDRQMRQTDLKGRVRVKEEEEVRKMKTRDIQRRGDLERKEKRKPMKLYMGRKRKEEIEERRK